MEIRKTLSGIIGVVGAARKYKKIIVTGDQLTFDAGAILGLASVEQVRFRDYIKPVFTDPVHGDNHMAKKEWEVVTPITFNRGAVLWVDEKNLPKHGEGIFKIVPMPMSYQEVSAPQVVKAEAPVGKIKTPEPSREEGLRVNER